VERYTEHILEREREREKEREREREREREGGRGGEGEGDARQRKNWRSSSIMFAFTMCAVRDWMVRPPFS